MSIRTNDHEIVIGSTTRRLTLIKDDEGRPMYQVTEDIPNYQSELLFTQKDWIGGHGQYDFEEPDMYFEGQSIDTFNPGKVILGPPIQTPGYILLIDGAVADDGGVQTTETSAARNATANDMTLLPATPADNDAYYFGADETHARLDINIGTAGVKGTATWTLTWQYYNGTSWASVGASDYTVGFTVSGTNRVTFTTPGDWAQVAVNGITKYWIRALVSGTNGNACGTQPKGTQAWFYGSDLDGENPSYFCWFGGASKWMCATATYVFAYDTSTDRWQQKVEFSGKTITDLKEHNQILYVALGSTSSKYYTSSDGDTYTITDLTDGYADKFLSAPNPPATANVLWKSKLPNEVRQTTDGQAGGTQWSSVAYVGDTSANITNLFIVNDKLYVGREDELFHYDYAGGVHSLMPNLKYNRSTKNFKYVAHWFGSTYFSLVTGIGEIDSGGLLSFVGPLRGIDDIDKEGTCVGLGSDRNFLFVAIDEGTNTHIYKGQRSTTGRWQWCPNIFLSTNACAVIAGMQQSATIRKLWFGYGNNASYSALSDNPIAHSGPFASSGWLRMSYTFGTNRYWDKLWQSIVTETVGCNTTGENVTPKYRDDTDTTATALTAAITTNGTVKTNLTTALNNKRIQFELHLASNTTSTTPEVLFFQARGIEKPETVRIHECVYKAADKPQLKGKTVRDFLRTGRTSTSLIKFADLRYGDDTAGTEYVWVVMMPGYPKEIDIIQEKGRTPERGIQIRLQEVSFTIS